MLALTGRALTFGTRVTHFLSKIFPAIMTSNVEEVKVSTMILPRGWSKEIVTTN